MNAQLASNSGLLRNKREEGSILYIQKLYKLYIVFVDTFPNLKLNVAENKFLLIIAFCELLSLKQLSNNWEIIVTCCYKQKLFGCPKGYPI